jgi:serine protease Do
VSSYNPRVAGLDRLAAFSDELAELVGRVVPSIVALSIRGADFSGSGSGFLVDDRGHVITNAHVVEGFTQPIDVVVHGGERTQADVVGVDTICDIAMLVLRDRPEVSALELRAHPARLGELCFGLGSPLGVYPESVSIGVVSGVGRTIRRKGMRPIYQAIQTDVAISPGNSGGPLVDTRGHVLGVNQCVDARGAGISFAIPAATARAIALELEESGRVERATLGVTVVRRTASVEDKVRAGLAVTRIGDEASAGGLELDDLLIEVDGQPVSDAGDLFALMTKDRIGQTMEVTVVRNGKAVSVIVQPGRLGGSDDNRK